MIELLLAAERALEIGDVDAAETMYRQVAETDQRNAIAVVGLARAAQARGDEARAAELVRRALEIDPEDAAARRLVEALDASAAGLAPGATPGTTPGTTPTTDREPSTIEPPAGRRRPWRDRLLRRGR